MQSMPLRVVQITDPHLFADENKALLGVKPQESFQAVLDLVVANNHQPDFILLTGDISQDASETAYRRIAEQISMMHVPVYCIPGNHDNSDVMNKVFPYAKCSMQKQLVFDDWQFILLDSHIHGKVAGNLAKSELDFLQQCLNQYPKHRAVIVFHHHPIPVNCEWLDKIGVLNANELWELLKHYPQVHSIIFGHIHQQHEGEKNHITYYATPSTCIQFKTNHDAFALDNLNPGYRVFEFYPNGELKTNVIRLPYYVGQFEMNAKGY